MVFLISIVLAVLFVLFCGETLRKHPVRFYITAAVISVLGVLFTWYGTNLPTFLTRWVLPVFSRGGLAGGLFIIVMVTGAFPNGSAPMKRLMPIRGELSIIASILTLGHNAAYGKTYFIRLFVNPAALPTYLLLASLCSVMMILIMLPLFITSFKSVRQKMKAKTWKKLQRFAYGFYALMYFHVMLMNVPYAIAGRSEYALNVFVYSEVFISYLICRILKYVSKGRSFAKSLPKKQIIGMSCGVFAVASVFVLSLFFGDFLLPRGSVIYAETINNSTDAVNIEKEDEGIGMPDLSESGMYYDGVYTGSGMGMNAKITVSVTVENDVITDVVIESAREDEPYFSDARTVVEDIIKRSSTDVDTVSGATYSSGGIIDAVADALEKAKK